MKKLFVLIVISLVLFAACTKTKPDPSISVATYTLGTGDSCTAAMLSGRYVADTALTNANTVTITVNVTLTGPYWISTNIVNGISFSSASTFLATGPQTVVLTGTGIPLAIDTATFTLKALNGLGDSCTFSVATVQGIQPNYYLTCFLNGVYRNFGDSASASNSFIPGTSGSAGFDAHGQDTVINYTSTIEFGVASTTPISAGTYTDTSGVKAYFNYIDSAAQEWSVNTTTQPSFTVTINTISGNYAQGTFSGTIKSQQGTGVDSITVTNGVFSVPVR